VRPLIQASVLNGWTNPDETRYTDSLLPPESEVFVKFKVNDNNNTITNVYSAVITAEPLRELTRFI